MLDRLRSLFGAQAPAPVAEEPARPARREPRIGGSFRSFEAARLDRLSAGFDASNLSADQDVFAALDRLRGRSRNLANNNDYARKFLQMVVTHVVGPNGFALQVQANDLGKPDRQANDIIERSFWQWARRGVCETSGMLSFEDVQRLVIRAVARDGEALVRRVRGGRENPWAYALQVLDIDRLQVNHNAELPGGNRVVMGIEIDRVGRPVAYHLFTKHPGQNVYVNSQGQRVERVPASDILHLFIADRPEQRRGVPWLHTAMLRLEMLGKFEFAALAAARKGAETLGFFCSPNGDAPPPIGDASEDGELITTSVPGHYDTLPAGYDFKPYESQYPNSVFDVFVKATLRGIASGLGVSYHTISNDLEGVNFSSIRTGVLEERDNWMVIQNWFAEAFLVPVYRDWLEMSLLSGALAFGNGSTLPMAKLDKFSEHAWQGRRWSWIDPLKDVNASIAAINAGLKSRREVASEQGRDLDDVWNQLQQEMQEAERLGLSIVAQPVAMPAGKGEEDDDAPPKKGPKK